MALSIPRLNFTPALFNMPMKFECAACHQNYLHPYSLDAHHYPACPNCQQAGLLQGLAETEDLIHHPIQFLSNYRRMLKSARDQSN